MFQFSLDSDDVKSAIKFIVLVLILGGLFAIPFALVAYTRGIGYTATCKVTSIQSLHPGHTTPGMICNGSLDVTFSPSFFPLSHMAEVGNITFVNMTFMYYSNNDRFGEPASASPEEVEAFLLSSTIAVEINRNIPYFWAIGCVISFATMIIYHKIKKQT